MHAPHANQSLPHGFSACSPALLSSLEDAMGLASKTLPLTSDYTTLKQAWCRIVEEYTARRLTYPEMDKLVAISAIASRCHRMNDMCVAGHFRSMLPQSLGWSRDPRDKLRDPASQFSRRLINPSDQVTEFGKLKTPTWSWASMDVPLVRPHTLYYDWMPLANLEVYSAHQVDDEDPACPVYTILLSICTRCFVLTWKEEKNQQDPPGLLLLWVDLSRQWMKLADLGLIKVVLDNPNDQLMDGARYLIAALSFDADGRNPYVLPGYRDIESLVLRETSIAGINAYERIGSCTMGVQVDEKQSEISSEEMSKKLSAHGWNEKVIKLC
jgi:hypothetical protein